LAVNRSFYGKTNSSSEPVGQFPTRSLAPAGALVLKFAKYTIACFAFMKENVTHLFVSIATTTSTVFLLILATASAALGLLPFPGEYRIDGFTFARLHLTPPAERFAEGAIHAGAPPASRDEQAPSSGVVAGKMLRSGFDGQSALDL
jgi:hypothetical protein